MPFHALVSVISAVDYTDLWPNQIFVLFDYHTLRIKLVDSMLKCTLTSSPNLPMVRTRHRQQLTFSLMSAYDKTALLA